MRKITNRAFVVLILAFAVLFGMCFYLHSYLDHGQNWALYFSGANSDSSGMMIDRNGIMLASFNGEETLYSPDADIRTANYHVTGDYWDRTGTGILSDYWKNEQGFSLLTGTTHPVDSVMTLNIDARLNSYIYHQLCEYENPALMLVCNYETGELVGMVSTPSIDPAARYEEDEIPDGAFLNRCLSASYTPGSIFKLCTAAAALEDIPDIESRSFFCDSYAEIAGVSITCLASHGTQSFGQALSNSCNIAFANIAISVGQEAMVSHVRDYGFLDSHTLSGIPCAKGNFPVDFVGDPELGWAGIGQSVDLVNPYQELRFICAIANGGTLIEPQLVRTDDPEMTELLPSAVANRLRSMMRYNAIDHYSSDEAFPGLEICAKTGTAELGDGDSHSWFVGFLDDSYNPYAFVTMVERGGFGLTAAGSITNDVMQWAVNYLE